LVSEPEPPELEPSELEPELLSPLAPLAEVVPLAVEPEAPADVAAVLALFTPGSGLNGLRVAPPIVCSAAPLVVSATEVFVVAAAVTAIPEVFGTATGVLAAGAGELEPPPIAA
jgi:hypothetical protein